MKPKKYKKCPKCKQVKVTTSFYVGEDICRTCSNLSKHKRAIPRKYLVRGTIQYPSSSSLGVSYA